MWPPAPSKKAECTKCGVMPAFVCPCGAQRCGKCLQPPPPNPFAPVCVWQQHPVRPLPFYVIDQRNVSVEDKLAWMKHELPEDTQLPEFAEKFVELFGSKIKNAIPQKNACLEVFGLYSGSAWKKQVDIPPKLRVQFRRVWDEKAPDICAECGKDMFTPGMYCGAACANAATKLVCRTCKAHLDAVHPYCGTCKKGVAPSTLKRKHEPTSEVDKLMQRNRESLSIAQRMWFGNHEYENDSTHAPAWKSRKRG